MSPYLRVLADNKIWKGNVPTFTQFVRSIFSSHRSATGVPHKGVGGGRGADLGVDALTRGKRHPLSPKAGFYGGYQRHR